MKKKLLVLVAMLLCIVTVLSACGETVRFKKIVADEYVDQNPTLNKAEVVTLTGNVAGAQEGDLLYFEGQNDDGKVVYTVYNVAENKIVWTATATETTVYTVHLMDGHYEDIAWFAVTATIAGEDDETFTKDIYDQYGTKVVTFDPDEVPMETVLDLILVDNKAYRIAEDGTIAEAFEMNALSVLPEVDYKVGDYYFANENGKMACYDDELNITCYYETPAYASLLAGAVLNNGNLLVQYKATAAWDAEDYTYITNSGSKVVLTSLLITPKNGKVKELDLDFVILYGASRTLGGSDFVDFDLLNEKIENVALVSYIVDERLVGPETLTGESALFSTNTSLIKLSNKGKDQGKLDETIVAQAMLPEQVAEERWVVYDLNERIYLLNAKGKIMAEISNIDDANAAYIVGEDGKLYNWDLEVVFDFEDKELEIEGMTNRGIFFEDEDGVVTLFANGEQKTIVAADADREVIQVRDNYFIVEDASGDATKYEIYNDVGTLLYTVEKASGSATAYHASNNAILLTGIESDGKDVVIRLAV